MLRNDKMVGLFFIIENELITESEHFTKEKTRRCYIPIF